MQYQTVFDITEAGFKSWDFSAFGIIFIVIGILAVLFQDKLPFNNKHPKFRKIFLYIWLGFAIFWTVTSFASTYYDYYHHSSEYLNGNYQVAEGYVTNFIPMPYGGHSQESFCVDNYPCFDYSDYGITAGFNNAKSHGGPISEGLPVRVSYIGNTIVKLEVGIE